MTYVRDNPALKRVEWDWKKNEEKNEKKGSHCVKIVIIALKFVRKILVFQILLQLENCRYRNE